MCLYFHFCSQVSLLRNSSRVHTKKSRSRIGALSWLSQPAVGHSTLMTVLLSIVLKCEYPKWRICCHLCQMSRWRMYVNVRCSQSTVGWSQWSWGQSMSVQLKHSVKSEIDSDYSDQDHRDEDHQKWYYNAVLPPTMAGLGSGSGSIPHLLMSHTAWPGVMARGNTFCCRRSRFGCD